MNKSVLVPAFTNAMPVQKILFIANKILLDGSLLGASGKGVRKVACLEMVNLH